MALCSRAFPPFAFRPLQAFIREDFNFVRDGSARVKVRGQSLRYITSTLFQPLVINGSEVYQHDAQQATLGEDGESLFEAVTGEYTDVEGPLAKAVSDVQSVRTVVRKGLHHRITTTTLANRIKAREWGVAENLRDEYLENDIHIQRDPVFGEAAIRVWRIRTPEERTEAFYQWIRLLPNATVGRIRQTRMSFDGIKRTLFTKGPSDLDTIACCGIVAARKGFVNHVCLDILAHITRYTPPHLSAVFFAEMEKSAKAFYGKHKPKTKEGSRFSIWDAAKWNNIYLRNLVLSGYCEAAAGRLRYMGQKGIEAEGFSMKLLTEELKKLRLDDLADEMLKISPDLPVDIPSREKKQAIAYSATDVVQLIDIHVNANDLQALSDLKEDIVGNRTPDLWVVGQMKFYQERHQHALVLQLFLDHFMCVGASKRQIADYIRSAPSQTFNPLLTRVGQPARPLQGRWPTSHVLTIVWSSVTAFAANKRELAFLYAKFLSYWYDDDGTSPTPAASSQPWSNFRFRHPPATAPDSVMFHIFLTGFKKFNDLEAVLQVLHDMTIRGVRPDTHNWTVVAGMFAKDDPTRAEKILFEMEKGLEEGKALDEHQHEPTRSRTGPAQRSSSWVPIPTIVTYTAILRGLIESHRLGDARKFVEKIEAIGVKPGMDARLDHVVEILWQRQRRATAQYVATSPVPVRTDP